MVQGFDRLHPIQKWALIELLEVDAKIEENQGTRGDRMLRKRRAKLWQVAYQPTARQKVLGIRKGFLNMHERKWEGSQRCVDAVMGLLYAAQEDLRDRGVYSPGGENANQR